MLVTKAVSRMKWPDQSCGVACQGWLLVRLLSLPINAVVDVHEAKRGKRMETTLLALSRIERTPPTTPMEP